MLKSLRRPARLFSLAILLAATAANGQIIQASSYYDHQWLSSDGKTLIQTNDTLDPNGVVYPVSQSWTELVPK